MAHHALVFGASGILGWAIVNEILSNYPNQGTYSKITALTNRSLSREDALWPAAAPGMPELDIVSGIDLTKGTVEEVKEVMMERVPSIGTVTHVFYFGKNLPIVNYYWEVASLIPHQRTCFIPIFLPSRNSISA